TRLASHCDEGAGGVLIVVFRSNPSGRTRHGGNMHFVYVTIPTKGTKKRAYIGDWASSTSRRRRIRPTNQRSVLIKSQIRAIESPYYVLPSVQVNWAAISSRATPETNSPGVVPWKNQMR